MDLVVTRGPGGFVVRQGGPKGDQGPPGPSGEELLNALGAHTARTDNPHAVTKAQVGLGNADNTSDVAKPISSAVQDAIDDKLDATLKGAADGLAELDGAGKVPSSQISITGAQYKGLWNATSNSPTVADGSGTAGDWYWVTTTSGSAFSRNLGSGSVSWVPGNRVLYNGSIWEQGANTSAVASVDYSGTPSTGAIVIPRDSAAATSSLRKIGSAATEAAAGNHAHAIGNITGVPSALATAIALSSDLSTFRGNAGFGSAATLNVPASGDAAAGEAVKGDDSRLGAAVLEIVPHTDHFTPALGDQFKGHTIDAATAKKWTLPLNSEVAFPAKTNFPLIVPIGAGGLSIAPDVLLEEQLADSPLVVWPTNESAGTTAQDGTANNRDGTYGSGVALQQAGPLPEIVGVDLDGTANGKITSAYSTFTASGDYTFEGLFYRDAASGADAFFGGDHATTHPYLLISSGTSDIAGRLRADTGNFAWAAAWPGNTQWVHIAVTMHDGASADNVMELFVDGVSKGTRTVSGVGFAGTNNFCVGGRGATASTDPFNGKVANPALYSGLLSAARIKAHSDAAKIRIRSGSGSPRQAGGQDKPLALYRLAADDWLLIGDAV